ncbi:uncharacterized protein [Clytia hemisphaerica]
MDYDDILFPENKVDRNLADTIRFPFESWKKTTNLSVSVTVNLADTQRNIASFDPEVFVNQAPRFYKNSTVQNVTKIYYIVSRRGIPRLTELSSTKTIQFGYKLECDEGFKPPECKENYMKPTTTTTATTTTNHTTQQQQTATQTTKEPITTTTWQSRYAIITGFALCVILFGFSIMYFYFKKRKSRQRVHPSMQCRTIIVLPMMSDEYLETDNKTILKQIKI